MLWVVPFRQSSTLSPVKRGPEADMFSSTAQVKVQWSTTTLRAATVEKASTSQPLRLACSSAPGRMRMCRRITSCDRGAAEIDNDARGADPPEVASGYGYLPIDDLDEGSDTGA